MIFPDVTDILPSINILRVFEPALYRFSKRFFGGRTHSECFEKVRALNQCKRKAVINFLGEHLRNPEEVRETVAEYIRLLRGIARHGLDASISVKLTQIGLDINPDLGESNLETICNEARIRNVDVEIDMEDSYYTERTIGIVTKLAAKYQLRIALQANLMRSQKDIERLITRKVRIRLCKGAYEEPPRISYTTPFEINLNYLFLAFKLLQESSFPALATHDIDLIRVINRRFRIIHQSFEFQMLYGVRPDLQRKLVEKGYTLRVYIPYGSQWLAYGIRRWKKAARMFFGR